MRFERRSGWSGRLRSCRPSNRIGGSVPLCWLLHGCWSSCGMDGSSLLRWRWHSELVLRLCLGRRTRRVVVALILLQHPCWRMIGLCGLHPVHGRSHGCWLGSGGPLLHVGWLCVVRVLLLLLLHPRRRRLRWRDVLRWVSLLSRHGSGPVGFRILQLRQCRWLCLDRSFEGTLRWELDVS